MEHPDSCTYIWMAYENVPKSLNRGEYEITSVNSEYIKRNTLEYDIVNGEWADAGTFESYFEANKLLYRLGNQIKIWSF